MSPPPPPPRRRLLDYDALAGDMHDYLRRCAGGELDYYDNKDMGTTLRAMADWFDLACGRGLHEKHCRLPMRELLISLAGRFEQAGPDSTATATTEGGPQ